jgi:ferredoxin
MMKGIICYYSGSGNTKLACDYISRNISGTDFELYNIVGNDIPNWDNYDIVGLASFTDFWGTPQLFHSFLNKVDTVQNKNAFVLNTYGFFSGKTLKQLSILAKRKGFNVLAGHSLHTPENYPPMRTQNREYDDAPKPKEFEAFNDFISRLNIVLNTIASEKKPKRESIKIGLMGTLLPAFSRTMAKKDFGNQEVNESLCSECGVCSKGCPYGAIQLNPYPVFDHDKCFGCWYCYNHCHVKAIYTPKFNGTGHYPRPIKELVDKLG